MPSHLIELIENIPPESPVKMLREAVAFDLGDCRHLPNGFIDLELAALPFPTCFLEFQTPGSAPNTQYQFGVLAYADVAGVIAKEYIIFLRIKTPIQWIKVATVNFESGKISINKVISSLVGSNDLALVVNLAKITKAGIAVINAKNVVTVDNYPSPRLNAARIRRGKLPLLVYKTLHIHTAEKRSNSSARVTSSSDHSKPLSLWRGHFKRRRTGTFFWMPHYRGCATQGVIYKDYLLRQKRDSVDDLVDFKRPSDGADQ